MRFMMLMISKGYETAAPGTMPDDLGALDAMMAYNRSLAEARGPARGRRPASAVDGRARVVQGRSR